MHVSIFYSVHQQWKKVFNHYSYHLLSAIIKFISVREMQEIP